MTANDTLTTEEKAIKYDVLAEISSALRGIPHNPENITHLTTEEKAAHYPTLLKTVLLMVEANNLIINQTRKVLNRALPALKEYAGTH